jgi:inner membrane protein
MDSITHIVLGACIGEAFLGKAIGKKALLVGVIAQSVPDIDFVAALWLDPADNLLAHRGITHSILFMLLMSALLAATAQKWYRKPGIPGWRWFLFFSIQLSTHIFLDTFNAYGVGLFEPVSHVRFSFNMLYVADPFFTIWTGIAFLILLLTKTVYRHRSAWAKGALVISMFYLLYCGYNKTNIGIAVDRELANQGIPYSRYLTTPSPLNNWLWFIAVDTDSAFYTGYRSVFNRGLPTSFTRFPKNHSFISRRLEEKDIDKLTRFSKGWYTLEQWHDTLVFNDLRFGQIVGWRDPCEHFVFHYFIDYPKSNKLVMQRGRFEKWDNTSVGLLLKRIKGY